MGGQAGKWTAELVDGSNGDFFSLWMRETAGQAVDIGAQGGRSRLNRSIGTLREVRHASHTITVYTLVACACHLVSVHAVLAYVEVGKLIFTHVDGIELVFTHENGIGKSWTSTAQNSRKKMVRWWPEHLGSKQA